MRRSAGVLLFRRVTGAGGVEVLLGHPGGPLWARKDDGAWSVPKGEYTDGEEPRAAAEREFGEEVGLALADVSAGPVHELGELRLPSGKRLTAFAVEGDLDPAAAVSNTFEMPWPPRSGRVQSFPELDRVAWFDLSTARTKITKGQLPLLDRLPS